MDIRLVAPAGAPAEPALDADQQAAVDAFAGARALLVTGPPGSGKTRVAVALAAQAVAMGDDPDKVVVLAPTRVAAGRLRDRVSAALEVPTGVPSVRTPSSLAYAVVRALADAQGRPRPTLVTGAEQDAVLREMLANHAQGIGAVPDWRGLVPPEATGLPAFRAELRDLLDRAAERGVEPEDLARLGGELGRPEWAAAALVQREYRAVMGLQDAAPDRGRRHDQATIIAEAAHTLEHWPATGAGQRPSWQTVVVDDAQDLTAAALGLLKALAADGARLVLIGNADQAVQGYRGAVPAALAAATDSLGALGLSAAHVRLRGSHRMPAGVEAVVRGAVARVGVLGVGSARLAPAEAPGSGPAALPDASVVAVAARHRYAQSRAVAAELRRARHRDGVPWSRMAVVARSGAALRELRSDLVALDVPCGRLADGLALPQEPAVRPLLDIARLALGEREGGEEWTDEGAESLLGCRLVGLDPLGQRRLRRALVVEERAGGGERAGAELLREALADPARLASLQGRRSGGPEARAAERLARAVAAARGAAHEPGATAGTVLWAAWESLGVAEQWRRAALAGSDRDDADLDAVVALMRAAQGYAERMPEGGVRGFLDHLEGQEFSADSLAPVGAEADAVALATPAAAAGREWDVVAVAGLEEGSWPNLRLRDSVLGAQHLVEVLAGRAPREPLDDDGRAQAARQARAAVLEDEARLFAVAASRARLRLVLTASLGEEAQASRFLVEAARHAGVEVRGLPSDDAAPAPAAADEVADLREAVARLRVEAERGSGPARAARAEMLARLAAAGAQGADPSEWHGVAEPSTLEPYYLPDQQVRVSPSAVGTAEECALKWALTTAGGKADSGAPQRLGTLVHAIAQEHPRGGVEAMLATLEERWHEVGGRDTWAERVEHDRAVAMVHKLSAYLEARPDGEVLLEAELRVELGRALLAGTADRVEVADGVARVADLKTSKSAPSIAEAAEHAQLAMYQLAAAHGAFGAGLAAGGAELVVLGEKGAKAVIRTQPPIDVEGAEGRLAVVVEGMAAAAFPATPSRQACERCPVRSACPAQPEGRQVSEG